MTLCQAQEIIEEDDDYDEDGNLSDSATERLEELNEMSDDSEE